MKRALIIFKNGRIKREENTVAFIDSEGGKRFIPVESVSEIEIFGEVDINKKALSFFTQSHIPLHFYNYYGYYVGTYYPRDYLNSGYVTLKQAEYYLNDDLRMFLAQSFVYGSFRNMKQNLKNYNSKVDEQIEDMDKLSGEIFNSQTIEELMGIEGNLRSIYYSAFNSILSHFSFDGRNKRPPEDEVNAMISFGNTLMYTKVLSTIYSTHLDPRIGYLHETNTRSFSLNLDIAEIFKPIVVDRAIFYLVNKGIIKKEHFAREVGLCYLNEQGKRIFVEHFENRLKSTIKHRKLNRKVSFGHLIKLECYKLEKHLIGDEVYKPFIMRW